MISKTLKRGLLAVLIIALPVMVLWTPGQGEAQTELQKIEEMMAQLNEEIEQAKQRSAEAEGRLSEIRAERGEAEQELVVLNTELEETIRQLEQLESEIAGQEAELEDQKQKIDETVQRINERDQLLRSRLHFMYTNGSVSYLEVLFNATSFTDFLERFNSLKSFVGQDKQILESAKRDRELFNEQKEQMETLLASLELNYAEADSLREQQEQQIRQQESIVATLTANEEHWELIHEEEEQFLLEEAARMQAELSEQLEEAKRKEEERRRLLAAEGRSTQDLDGELAYPLPQNYIITSGFGYRTDPFTGQTSYHGGIDFGAPKGTNVLAAANGVVLLAEEYGGYGNTVIIDHGDGLWTLYGHMTTGSLVVESGDYVEAGQKVGQVGSTGRSTGPHLHFEVFVNQEKVNPANYLNL